MSVVHLVTDAEAEENPTIKGVFDDIRETRGSDFINNIWRALAADPAGLKRTWDNVKSLMTVPGALDPKIREMIYMGWIPVGGRIVSQGSDAPYTPSI
jgi:alkylhydroperoxidase family enzyme